MKKLDNLKLNTAQGKKNAHCDRDKGLCDREALLKIPFASASPASQPGRTNRVYFVIAELRVVIAKSKHGTRNQELQAI